LIIKDSTVALPFRQSGRTVRGLRPVGVWWPIACGIMSPCVPPAARFEGRGRAMVKFLLWLLLLVVCWPLALLALVLWPVVWVLSLPFRLVGILVEGVFALLRAVVTLPARLLGWRPQANAG
jgi:hypothetical protein